MFIIRFFFCLSFLRMAFREAAITEHNANMATIKAETGLRKKIRKPAKMINANETKWRIFNLIFRFNCLISEVVKSKLQDWHT